MFSYIMHNWEYFRKDNSVHMDYLILFLSHNCFSFSTNFTLVLNKSRNLDDKFKFEVITLNENNWSVCENKNHLYNIKS